MPLAKRSPGLVLAAATALASCAESPQRPSADAERHETLARTQPSKVAKSAPEPPEPPDPWQAQLSTRVLAPSGLDRGSVLVGFDVLETAGERDCLGCGDGLPTIIAVGTTDDAAFRGDLLDLDAIVHKYRGEIAAVAVITELEDGKARAPRDPNAALEQARALEQVLQLDMKLVVPAPASPDAVDVWGEYYNVGTSRTVMFADGARAIRFAATGPEDWSELDAAIREVLALPTG